MKSFLSLLVLLVGDAAAMAQAKSVQLPVGDRPDGFSNIVGKYAIKVSAEPTDVQVEEAITLRIYLTGSGPEEYEPIRKSLRLLPEAWQSDFYVQELPDKHEVLRDKKTWLFVYRLKPKHVKVDVIDDIKLVYYDPDLPGARKYVTKYADRIPLNVKPKANPSDKVELEVPAVPESFYEVVRSSDVLVRSTSTMALTSVQLALFLVLPPLACLAGVLTWRKCFPDASQRAVQHRNAAAQRALDQLQESDAILWDVVRRYLHERCDFPAVDSMPAEVSAYLKRRGFALAVCRQAQEYFVACDAMRFTAAAGPQRQTLADEAVRLIQSLEADPCARG